MSGNSTKTKSILSRLGIPMSTAVDMYLNQIVLSGGIPFSVTFPKPPASIDASQMSEEDLHAKIKEGYDQAVAGNYVNASDVHNILGERYIDNK